MLDYRQQNYKKYGYFSDSSLLYVNIKSITAIVKEMVRI